ncbi:hypothetical protein [Sphingomonas sp. T9W2]|uniref:hypothetical protein n=1 Tax=Sphingomonas sp. T9W2 TaxID=3143183 RepID=UPI0031F50DBC
MQNLLLTGLQLATSVARLAAFAFSVLTIGRISGDAYILLVIGYLPFLAFFDILIQSASRAAHLRGVKPLDAIINLRQIYALVALALIGAVFIAGLSYPTSWAQQLLLIGAWPLGAMGFVWERWIAQRSRQWLLSGLELSLLAVVIAFYWLVHLSWQILLLPIISFPLARLVTLALPVREAHAAATVDTITAPINEVPPAFSRRWIGGYIGTSLAQQLVAACAVSLPAIHAQLTGNLDALSVNVTLFRSLHSFAAIISLTINAMSSRIFYRQTGSGFESFEATILDKRRLLLGGVTAFAVIGGVVALAAPQLPILFAIVILPIMAMINAESSMLYNRGIPLGTLQCQILILSLSAALLAVMLRHPLAGIGILALFLSYGGVFMPGVLARHRAVLGMPSTVPHGQRK